MNAIKKAFIMPHPPIIIPDIGGGSEEQASKTISGCKEIAKEIAAYSPETIVVITPHGPGFRDAICVNSNTVLKGSFARFGYRNLKYEFNNDKDFVDTYSKLLEKADIQSVKNNDKTRKSFGISDEIDHGVLVPIHFISEQIKEFKLVHITYGLLGPAELYKCGMALEEAASITGRKICVIASSDMSHRLSHDSPSGFDPAGAEYDAFVVDCIKTGKFVEFLDVDVDLREKAGECGHRSINIMLGAFEGRKCKTKVLSYEGPYGVGYMNAKIEDDGAGVSVLDEFKRIRETGFLKKRQKQSESDYVKLARKAIENHVKHGFKIKPENNSNIRRGAFVTIKKNNNLRGCIGTIEPTADCIENEIIENAINAAVNDPRFSPITTKELEGLSISVDVLFEPEKIEDIEQLDPQKYGVIVHKGFKKGLLLPNIDGIDSAEKQLQIACQKAGIGKDEEYEIERFQVVRHI